MKRRIVKAAAVCLAAGLCATAFGADEAFEDYSRAVSDWIAQEGDSAEDYFQKQEMRVGDEMEETESDEIRVDEEHFDEEGNLLVDAFRGYRWGTLLEEILEQEITEDMEEGIQYALKKVDAAGDSVKETYEGETFDSLGMKGYSIAGYDATSFYLFEEGKLTGGVYEFFLDEDVLLDVTMKCTSAYGEPSRTQDQEGMEGYALWVDPEKNFIFTSISLGVLYGQHDSAIIGIFSDGIERTCGISLESVIAACAAEREGTS